MHKPFKRDGPKIGRNDPCICGSGRKFKHCHGRLEYALPVLIADADLERQIVAEGKRQLEYQNSLEHQRQKQQGWGRPIISVEHKGYRFVAVSNRLYYGKWKTFIDFLHHYIKDTIGGDWGNAEIAKPFEHRHPVMQWYDKICRLQKAYVGTPGELFCTPVTGAVSAYNRLAYNLYLIAHNGKDIQTRLLARLRNKDNFQGAYFEIQVAAWLIRAGFELEFEDEQDGSSTHCEYTATYAPTGDKYSVEAKSRETRPGGSARTPVGQQLRKALVKKAEHKRLVFIDLNKALHTQEAAYRAAERAEFILKQSEKTMQIDDAPAPSAYVCITNLSDQHALDSAAIATMVSFVGFKLPDYMGEYESLREAVRARERHLPMFRLLKSIEEHNEIPQTFGGELPSEVFTHNDVMPRLKVGQLYVVPGPDGIDVPAELMQAVVMDRKAYAVLRDPKAGKNWIGTFEMTSEELADYARYPDTYFGVYQRHGKDVQTTMDMYDFFADSYEHTAKDKLIALLPNYPDQEELLRLSQRELVAIVAEGLTYGAIASGFKPKSREEIRGERGGKMHGAAHTADAELPL
ncbi:MAG: SEC-C domain-containing protein [Proteobacteria bacterium]|nr:SEC-C domain-containing protein [Pseudomonadota bacterium]